MSRRKDIIRWHDRVRILTPNVFVRCGYPLNKQIVKETFLSAEQKKAIYELMAKCGIHINDLDGYLRCESELDKTYIKILDAIAGALLAKLRWGGRERMIYEEYHPELLNATCQVLGKRVVKTGRYILPSISGYDYYNGGIDYDPAYLADEQTHVILEIATDGCNEEIAIGKKIEIQKEYVEKI